MNPYYKEAGITLYHGDCREVMASLCPESFDLVFTSPPYNLGITSGGGFPGKERLGHYADSAGLGSRGGGGKWKGGDLANGYADHDDAMPWPEYLAWQHDVLLDCWRLLTTAGAIFYNHKPRVQNGTVVTPLTFNPELPVRQIVIWARAGGINFAPTHYVPTHEWILILAKPDFRLKSKGASGVGDVWQIPQDCNNSHPAPFPIGLPARAIETTASKTVLDPYSGSGTTLRAAKDAGVSAVGIEKSERYCEMTVNRLRQGVLFGSGS